MNPLNSIKMHLKGVERAYAGIKTAETTSKAMKEIEDSVERMGIKFFWGESQPETAGAGQAITATLDAFPGTLGGELASGVPEVGSAPKAKEMGFPGVTTTHVNGVTTVFPHDYQQGKVIPNEIEGDTGSTGMFETVTVGGVTTLEPEKPVAVEMIGGWPERGSVKVVGLMPNRRHLRGSLEDGRLVCVERRLGWKVGEFKARLVMTGQTPCYRLM